MAKKYVVDFSNEDLHYAGKIAEARNKDKFLKSIESNKLGFKYYDKEENSEEGHAVGALGECAAAILLKGECEINENISSTGDPGYDFHVGAWEVEIKTRNLTSGKDFAMYDTQTELEADIGILCWKRGTKVEVVGWVTRDDWNEKSETLHFGDEKRNGIEWQDMRPISSLLNIVKS